MACLPGSDNVVITTARLTFGSKNHYSRATDQAHEEVKVVLFHDRTVFCRSRVTAQNDFFQLRRSLGFHKACAV